MTKPRWFFLSGFAAFVVAAVVAVPLSLLAIFTAPLHSPGLMGQAVCPPGSRLVTGEGSSDHDGAHDVAATCVTPNGAVVPRRELNEDVLVDAFPLYYPRVLAVCAALAIALAMVVTMGFGALNRALKRRPASGVQPHQPMAAPHGKRRRRK